MFSLILAHTNDFIPKEKFVAAGASLQFTFVLMIRLHKKQKKQQQRLQ